MPQDEVRLTLTFEAGRDEMLLSASVLGQLQGETGLDAEAMRSDRAEVHRRLVWAELQAGFRDHLAEDLGRFEQSVADLTDVERRRSFGEALVELRRACEPVD